MPIIPRTRGMPADHLTIDNTPPPACLCAVAPKAHRRKRYMALLLVAACGRVYAATTLEHAGHGRCVNALPCTEPPQVPFPSVHGSLLHV